LANWLQKAVTEAAAGLPFVPFLLPLYHFLAAAA
jgi:hypothetical protein